MADLGIPGRLARDKSSVGAKWQNPTFWMDSNHRLKPYDVPFVLFVGGALGEILFLRTAKKFGFLISFAECKGHGGTSVALVYSLPHLRCSSSACSWILACPFLRIWGCPRADRILAALAIVALEEGLGPEGRVSMIEIHCWYGYFYLTRHILSKSLMHIRIIKHASF
jgi:hypothetical protein